MEEEERPLLPAGPNSSSSSEAEEEEEEETSAEPLPDGGSCSQFDVSLPARHLVRPPLYLLSCKQLVSVLTVPGSDGGGRAGCHGGRGDHAHSAPPLSRRQSPVPGRDTPHAHLQSSCENHHSLLIHYSPALVYAIIIVLIFRGFLILQISRIWNHLQNLFSYNLSPSATMCMGNMHLRNCFHKFLQNNLRKFRLAKYKCYIYGSLSSSTRCLWAGGSPSRCPAKLSHAHLITPMSSP